MRLFEKTFGRFGDGLAEFGGEIERDSVSVGSLVRFVYVYCVLLRI